MSVSGCADLQEPLRQAAVAPEVKVAKLPPIEGRFTQLPRQPVCLDEGKKEYSVEELEKGAICYREDAARTRDNYRLYQKAVKQREGG
jgi:hypothetical protein